FHSPEGRETEARLRISEDTMRGDAAIVPNYGHYVAYATCEQRLLWLKIEQFVTATTGLSRGIPETAYAAGMVACFVMPGALPFPEPIPLEPGTYSPAAPRSQSRFCDVT